MADQSARINTPVSWVVAGAGDELTCAAVDQTLLDGVQIECQTVDFEDATITVYGRYGAFQDYAAPAGSGHMIRVGAGFSISKIVLSGFSVATHDVTFSQ